MSEPAAANRQPAAGGLGATVALGGAGVVLLSSTSLSWWVSAKHTLTFRSLAKFIPVGPVGNATIFSLYFSWLSWALMFSAVVLAVAASMPVRAAGQFRIAGTFLALLGAALTPVALYSNAQSLEHSVEHVRGAQAHASVGPWVALGGYVLIAAGALAAPLRLGIAFAEGPTTPRGQNGPTNRRAVERMRRRPWNNSVHRERLGRPDAKAKQNGVPRTDVAADVGVSVRKAPRSAR